MPEPSKRENRRGNRGVAALAIGVLAIACCAGAPLIAAVASGVAIGTLVGVGGGILAAAALTLAVLVGRTRRRSRATDPPRRQPVTHIHR